MVDISVEKLFYFTVIFLLCYLENILATVVKCEDVIEDDSIHTLCYLDKNFLYPQNYDETQKVTLCFQPELNFKFFALSILNDYDTSSLELAQLDSVLTRDALNKVTLAIKKQRNDLVDSDYYSTEIILNDNSIASGDLLAEKLENGKELELFLSGPWIGSREITTKDQLHLTNCDGKQNVQTVLAPTNPITFNGCKDDYPVAENVLTTICFFHHLDNLTLEQNPSWKICFKPGNTFQHLAITSVDLTSKLYANLIFLPAESVNISQLNEHNFDIKDFKPILVHENNLQFLISGDWEGSRDFSTEDNINFTNCHHEEVTTQTHSSTIQPSFETTFMSMIDNPTFTAISEVASTSSESVNSSAIDEDVMAIDVNRNDTSTIESQFQDPVFRLNVILLIAGVLLLSLTVGGIICCLVLVILRRQTRKAKEKAKKQRQSSIPILQLPKDFQKNRFSYFNVLTTDSLPHRDMSSYNDNEVRDGHEDPDVTYTTVDFQVVSNQDGKSVKEVIIFPKLFKTNSTHNSLENRNEGGFSGAPPDLTCQLK